MSTVLVLCLLFLSYAYYACTMLVLCLYYAYYACTMPVLCLLCLYLFTMPIYNHRHSFTGTRCCYSQRWAKHFFRTFLKIVCGLVNQVTSHRFSLVNFAIGCQYFLHRLCYYWMINHFYVSCKYCLYPYVTFSSLFEKLCSETQLNHPTLCI